jgi:hypothetical protein
MLFRPGRLLEREVEFAEMFVRAPVPGIEHQRLMIVSDRGPDVRNLRYALPM